MVSTSMEIWPWSSSAISSVLRLRASTMDRPRRATEASITMPLWRRNRFMILRYCSCIFSTGRERGAVFFSMGL